MFLPPLVTRICAVLIVAPVWGKAASFDATAAQRQKGVVAELLAWNIETLSGAFRKVGNTNATWDAAAIEALDVFARIRSGPTTNLEALSKTVGRLTDKAIAGGCEDPLVQYVHLRYTEQPISSDRYRRELSKAADRLIASEYPAIRKVYAAMRAAQEWKEAGTNFTSAMHHYRRAAMRAATNVVADKKVPVTEIDDVCTEILTVVAYNETQAERFYKSIEGPLFQNWPNHHSTWLIKGQFYIDYAWSARGYGLANTVPEGGWELFRARLKAAANALERAWELNKTDVRVPIRMLRVELGQGTSRERMELWFSRAMALDPNSDAACYEKFLYVQPLWYGTPKDMLAFGRECVASTKWGGQVPLMLVTTHEWLAARGKDEEAKQQYWKSPAVWKDIRSAYEKFFQLNPSETGWRHNYARHAYWAEQWNDLNKQLPLLGKVNYEYFGGRVAYDKMVAEAARHKR